MKLIQNVIFQLDSTPPVVIPGKGRSVHYAGGTKDSLRLKTGRGISTLSLLVKSEEVERILPYVVNTSAKVSPAIRFKSEHPILSNQLHFYIVREGSPDGKIACSITP